MLTFGQESRAQQALFRDTSPSISEAARHPTDDKGERNRHLLAVGHEEENLFPSLRGPDGARRFFSDRKIKWWRSTGRGGDAPGINMPTRNLASSQVACVNSLLPLASVPGAVTACLQALDSNVEAVTPIKHNGLISPLEFEWLGLSSTLEESAYTRGANATSADAFMLAECVGGSWRAYLFEWKYSEAYEIGRYQGEGRAGETRRKRYQHLYCAADSSFAGQVPLDELLYEPIYQIVRLRLLADRMVRCSEFGVSQAKVIVVCPEDNREYRDRITSPELANRLPAGVGLGTAVRSLLKDPEGFSMTSPEALARGIRQRVSSATITEWFEYHSERYGWSGPACDRIQGESPS
jgi:hypothetical protein